VAAGVLEELAALEPIEAAAAMSPPAARAGEVEYGHLVKGIWRCDSCGYERTPRELMDVGAVSPFTCPDCDLALAYEETL
jgi:hypothetical protein